HRFLTPQRRPSEPGSRGFYMPIIGGSIVAVSDSNFSEAAQQHSLGAHGALEATQQPPQDLAAAVLESGVSLEAFEQSLLQRAVERANGNLAAAARLLGMTRPQLNYRIKKQSD
ncbi:MAG: hypothetical protein PWP11_3022, partial [Thauera sp.]